MYVLLLQKSIHFLVILPILEKKKQSKFFFSPVRQYVIRRQIFSSYEKDSPLGVYALCHPMHFNVSHFTAEP